MSKWFKALGLSVAVGTVVYGIIKYKSDEKFKKQVDDTVEKVEEKVQETGIKVSKFVTEHPGTTMLCVAGVGLGAAVFRRLKAENKKTIRIEQTYQTFRTEPEKEEPDPADIVQEEARLEAEKRMMYDNIMENPHDYYIIKKDDYEDLCHAAGRS